MANQFVGLPADQSGKKLQTFENSIGGNTVNSEAITVVNSSGVELGTSGSPFVISVATGQTVGLVAGAAVIGHVINDASTAVIGHVIVDSQSSGAVTNAGTFAVQATLAAETTKVIGTVNQGTSPWVVSGSGNFTAVQATGSNLHTVVDSGTITAVTAITNALPAGTNVIGHVIVDTASTTAVTQATGSNLHAVLDAGSAVIGHVITDATSVTAATLSAETTKVIGTVNVAASQTIEVTNLGTFATQATLAAETTKVLGTVRLRGNDGLAVDAAGENASYPGSAVVVAGQFNTTPTTISSGSVSPFQLDSAGNLLVNIKTGGGSGSNLAASSTGSPVPAAADYIGFSDGSGNLLGVSATNPLPITGSISATNPSVSTVNAAAPSSATLLGMIDGAAKLQGVSATNPLPITGSISATNPSVSTTGTGVPASATYLGGNKGSNLVGLLLDTSGNLQTVISEALPAGTNVIGHVITDSSSVTAATLNAETTKVIGVIRASDGAGNLLTSNSTTYTAKFGLDSNLLGTLGTAFTTAGFVDIKGADGNVFVRNATAGNLLCTATIAASQTIAVTNVGTFAVQAAQATAANLNATVVGTGTFAVQDTVLDAAIVAQEATTSGVKGLTVFGAVTTASPSYTTLKSDALSLDVAGNLRVSLKDSPANTNKFLVTADAITIASAQTLATVTTVSTLTTVTNAVKVTGNAGGAFDAATAATPPANAVQTGIVGVTALPTAVSTGQLVAPMADKFGRQVVVLNSVRDLSASQVTTIASSAAETTIVTTGASGIFNDITGLQITNATNIAVTVTIKENTGGTTRKIYDIAANGGIVVLFQPPLTQGTAANTWTATLSVATVTVDVNVDFVKNK